MLTEQAYLHGKPESSGLLRSQISDLVVKENIYLYILEKQVLTLYLSLESWLNILT
jgi:hypothetical protein